MSDGISRLQEIKGDQHDVSCPLCESPASADAGRIFHPEMPRIGGVAIDLGPSQFHLRNCRNCGFQFKRPVIAEELLLSCYEKVSPDYWGNPADPRYRYFDLMHKLIACYAPGTRVLDVGCFNGALLAYLGPKWDRYGVEPSRGAATVAATQGISIIGQTLDDVVQQGYSFDAILAIDVVEHLVMPRPFFMQLSKCLSPGGIALIVTGNTAAWTWKLLGNRYWYCSLPEHVSFYNEASFDYISSQIGTHPVQVLRLGHQRSKFRRVVKDVVLNLVYLFLLRTRGLGMKPLKALVWEHSAPFWFTARDHLYYVMRKS